MNEAQVLSVNPSRKTIGELNHPSPSIFSVQKSTTFRASSGLSKGRSFLALSQADMERPAGATIVIRFLLAALAVTIGVLTASTSVMVVGAVIALLLAYGCCYRPTVLIGGVYSFTGVALLHGTALEPLTLVLAALFCLIGALAFAAGPGRHSADYILTRIFSRAE